MATDEAFPEVDVPAELHPGQNKNLEPDTVSSKIASDKEQEEEARKANAEGERDAAKTLKTAIFVSAVVVAVVGTAFAVSRKLKEK